MAMRVLALDIGKKRCGVAVSDPQMRVATPVCVLDTASLEAADARWQRVLEDWEPDLLLCGLPLSMDGTQGAQAKRIQQMAHRIGQAANVPVRFTDERLSSQQAKRSLHESGLTEREMRGKVDMIAASLFLQAWLDDNAAATQATAVQAAANAADATDGASSATMAPAATSLHEQEDAQ